MKKNFFKKLSFVMASAMVLSVISPAAGAFAAAAPALNTKSTQYLHLADEDKDEYDFNIKNKDKKAGWTYEWSSSNEKVAVVDEVGNTTAVGAGTAKITVVITDKEGDVVDTLTGTVTVRDNIKELTITNTPEEDTLAVGEARDFNRSYVTNAGKTTGTKAITRWVVAEEGATISDSGLFVAEKAGEYTITANAFQSKAKYTSWLADKEANADYVTATTEYKVTVANSIVATAQVDANKFTVTFASPVEALSTSDVEVNSMVGATNAKVKQVIKNVKLSDDKLTATVEMYVDFVAETAYVADVKGFDSTQFTAATKNVADVASVQIVTTTATVLEPKAIDFKLFNAAGVDITTTDLKNRVTLTSASETVYFNSTAKELTFYKVGDTTTVEAVFHTYNYDVNTGEEIGIKKAAQVITGIEKKVDSLGARKAYTIATAADLNFDKAATTLALGDLGKTLFVKYAFGAEDATKNSKDDSLFTFESTDPSKLMVGSNGALYTVKEGNVVVIVKYDNVIIDTIAVNVLPVRKATKLDVTVNKNVVSNGIADLATVTVEVKDQYDVAVEFIGLSATHKATNPSARALTPDAVNTTATKAVYTFDPAGADAGSYYFDIKSNDLVRVALISVQKADTTAPSVYYNISLNNTEFDLAISNDTPKVSAAIKVYGYDKNGIANDVVAVTGEGFTVKVTDKDGKDVALAADGTIVLAEAVSGSSINASKKVTGQYKVVLSNGTQVHDIKYFMVKDTQLAPQFVIDKLVSDKQVPVDAIKDAITVKFNGVDVEDNYDVVGFTVIGKDIHVKTLNYTQDIKGATLVHEIKVDVVITMK